MNTITSKTSFLILLVLSIPGITLALDLTLGVGACAEGGDYCPDPVGKIALTQGLWQSGRHAIQIEAVHYSEIGNGEPWTGDRGSEFLFLEYKVKLTGR